MQNGRLVLMRREHKEMGLYVGILSTLCEREQEQPKRGVSFGYGVAIWRVLGLAAPAPACQTELGEWRT